MTEVDMARDTEARREKLREDLIDAAEATIRAEGIGALRARSLATEVGCAVGAIYGVFDDMTDLVLAVNGRTFAKLGAYVTDRIADKGDLPPTDRLILIAKAYLHFAIENPHPWRSLFDVSMSTEAKVPEWYLRDLGRLFAIIARPLTEIFPDKPPEEIDLITRTLFSSVHGIVLLGLERRISGVPSDRIEQMIDHLIRGVIPETQSF
jgi:AcrR family transcriptional regulator